ncbi:MAG: hypothetical protein VB112_03195 [Oscillospiraceae bacterium]|nr:hypothetical protein [Oscillospiraceae bacterium]
MSELAKKGGRGAETVDIGNLEKISIAEYSSPATVTMEEGYIYIVCFGESGADCCIVTATTNGLLGKIEMKTSAYHTVTISGATLTVTKSNANWDEYCYAIGRIKIGG